MTNILEETQKSLAAAIARLEIQRLRIDKLKLENVHLRNVLRSHNINPGEEQAAGYADAPANEKGRATHEEQDGEEPIQIPVERNAEDSEEQDSDSHCILLHTRVENTVSKIPGRVSFKEDRIEFVAIAADIQPDTFVGVRYLGDMQEPRGAPLSRRSHQPLRSSGAGSTWWDTMFGSQGDLASAASLPASVQPYRFQTTPSGMRTPRSNQSESPALSPRANPAVSAVPFQTTARAKPAPADSSSAQDGSGSSFVAQMSSYLRRKSLPEAPVTWDKLGSAEVAEGDTGTWQIIWRELGHQGTLQTLSFEASTATRARIQNQVEQFQAVPASVGGTGEYVRPPQRRVTPVGQNCRVRDPEPLIPGDHTPQVAEPSKILDLEEIKCIAAGLPGTKKMCNWKRVYCADADGFSLQTLYRAGATVDHSVLIVEDFNGYVFGAFCPEPLKVKPRYQGTGQCFVFQMRPSRVKFEWHQLSPQESGGRNDFFMMVAGDSLGIGGAPHFAVWLDSDLLYGNSGLCNTFSSPCLAGEEDFKIKAVELFGVCV